MMVGFVFSVIRLFGYSVIRLFVYSCIRVFGNGVRLPIFALENKEPRTKNLKQRIPPS